MVKVDSHVVRACDSAKRPAGADGYRVDDFGVSADFADRRGRVKEERVAKFFLAFADGDQPLALKVPVEVVDTARERAGLGLEDVFLLRGVPDPDVALHVARRDVVARGAVARHSGVAGVLGVLGGYFGGPEVADHDGAPVCVQEIRALGVSADMDSLATRGCGLRRKGEAALDG